MTLELLQDKIAELPARERKPVERAITDLGETLISERGLGSKRELTAAQLEARNLKRVLAVWKQVARECLTAADLAEAGLSRQRLKQLRDEGRLVALRPPMRREFIYPAWQFDPATGRPLRAIRRIVKAAEQARLDPLGLHLLITGRAAEEDSAPAEWLAAGEGDYVVGLVAASNDPGS